MVEPQDDWHSFSGNLGPRLERVKLEHLAADVAAITGQPATIFKGGRYGIGPHTLVSLRALGFRTDLSICPAFDYGPMGGPDFTRFSARPGWFGEGRALLSLPTTAGWLGWLGRLPEASRARIQQHVPRAMLARVNALYPARLSPEGNDLATMQRLARHLFDGGLRVFTLSLHSPSLRPGNTPYARTDQDLQRLTDRTGAFLDFFREQLGGAFVTTTDLHRRLQGLG